MPKMTLLFEDNFHLANVCKMVDDLASAPDAMNVTHDGPLVHLGVLIKNELSRRGFDFTHYDMWCRDDVGYDPVEILTEQEFQRRNKQYKRDIRLVIEDERLMLELLAIIANCETAFDVRRNLSAIKENMLLIANWQADGRIASTGGNAKKRSEGVMLAVLKILRDGGASQSAEMIWRKLAAHTTEADQFEIRIEGGYLYSEGDSGPDGRPVKRSSFDRIVSDAKKLIKESRK